MSLDFNESNFKSLMLKTSSILSEWNKKIRGVKIYQNTHPSALKAVFDEELPENGMNPEDVLDKIGTDVFTYSNYNPSPNYYGYITGGGNQMAIMVEALRTALNQNNLKWHSAPANSEIEKIVIKWICEFIGFPVGSSGVLCSGGSVGNFLSMAIMRKAKAPKEMSNDGLFQATPMSIYVSEQGHSSMDKAMDMLGLGKKYLRKIPVKNDMTVNVSAMKAKIEEDINIGVIPIGIIGIAGTTNSGAIDPLMELSKLAKAYDLWFMVDAAYGGPAAGTEIVGSQFAGMEEADSLVINPHKWLYAPFEVSCVLVKDKKKHKDTFSMIPDYLKSGAGSEDREDLMDVNLQLTKDFKALKVWSTFKTYGAQKLRQAITNDILNARYMETLVQKSEDFEMTAPVSLSITCFRYTSNDSAVMKNDELLDVINNRILQLIEEDGRIFFAGTKINGQTSLRISCTNHRRTSEDIDFLMSVLRELALQALNEKTS